MDICMGMRTRFMPMSSIVIVSGWLGLCYPGHVALVILLALYPKVDLDFVSGGALYLIFTAGILYLIGTR